jgi:hypothetical protein
MCPRCFRLKHAEFDALDRLRPRPGRFRERVWPLFWRPRPRRIDLARLPLPSPCHAKWDRSLDKAIRLEIARRWMSLHPLERQWHLVDEACQLREPWHRW